MDRVATSKFLSYVLRHHPAAIGITLDEAGWVAVDALLDALRAHGRPLEREQLEEIVRTSDKQRFALEHGRIRAHQGHSVAVDLALSPREPPLTLFHGTVARFLDSIRREGLRRGARTHVHLSADFVTAQSVGARRGAAVVLVVDAASMHREGHDFSVTENGVWLVEAVPARFISFP
ncbi:MAG: RNA 2'-phosphotransferase [Deltaproteobacteria bacterium]|nr:RNA 2'-phosphotransferase [Deltaproteobacteria bacterium]